MSNQELTQLCMDEPNEKMMILEWKQRCNCGSGLPQYEVERGYRENVSISREDAELLLRAGVAHIRHAVDSAIDFAEDFDQGRDWVPGPYLT